MLYIPEVLDIDEGSDTIAFFRRAPRISIISDISTGDLGIYQQILFIYLFIYLFFPV